MILQKTTRATLPSPALQSVLRVPIVLGPLIAGSAILAAHLAGVVYAPEQYEVAPPTVSRLLTNPLIAAPFAIAMIVSAVFLAIAIFQVTQILLRHMRYGDSKRKQRIALIGCVLICEMVAVAGMIVLSQYTGDVNPRMHDRGSYMLFFGHAAGITLAGYLIRDLLGELEQKFSLASPPPALVQLRRFPRRASQVFILSVAYGVVYFGGKMLPDQYFFVQRAVLSSLEVIVIFSFLGFLMAFRPLVGQTETLAASQIPEKETARQLT